MMNWWSNGRFRREIDSRVALVIADMAALKAEKAQAAIIRAELFERLYNEARSDLAAERAAHERTRDTARRDLAQAHEARESAAEAWAKAAQEFTVDDAAEPDADVPASPATKAVLARLDEIYSADRPPDNTLWFDDGSKRDEPGPDEPATDYVRTNGDAT